MCAAIHNQHKDYKGGFYQGVHGGSIRTEFGHSQLPKHPVQDVQMHVHAQAWMSG